jgi:hypothetical protein
LYNGFIMKVKLIPLTVCMAIILIAIAVTRYPAQAAPPAQLTVFPTPTPGPDGKIIYIVQDQDTLWRISAITGVTIDQLRELNKLGPDDPIKAGDLLLIGFAGPVGVTPSPGPTTTSVPLGPTPTPGRGWGLLCIALYNDLNGDSLRQEQEPTIKGGAISVSNRLGTFSQTADTADAGETECNIDPFTGYEPLRGFVLFQELPEGEYTVSIAVPEGYNPTTEMNRTFRVKAGDNTYLSFGAQANTETLAETTLIPTTPGKSPLFGILGGVLLLVGVGLGIYANFLRRSGGGRGNKIVK